MLGFSKLTLVLPLLAAFVGAVGLTHSVSAQQSVKVLHKTVKVGDLDIFYREAGPKNAPAILLLHGFPTSSQMFRNLIPSLADEYRVIAPDYPGYGHSSMPPHDKFTYTFDNLAKVIDEFTEKVGLTKYALYVQDYGAPVGYRLASQHPERITAIVVQNGNAYDEGLDNKFWQPIKDYWKEPNSKAKRDAIRNLADLRCHQMAVHDRRERLRNSSARMERPTTSFCSTARETTKFNSTCSSATAATRRCIRSGRRTSASTSRRC